VDISESLNRYYPNSINVHGKHHNERGCAQYANFIKFQTVLSKNKALFDGG